MPDHDHYMQRALELASRGTGCVSPNPLVGCVVVRDGVIIGEGWHAIYGHTHAEVNALRDAQTRVANHSADRAEPGCPAHELTYPAAVHDQVVRARAMHTEAQHAHTQHTEAQHAHTQHTKAQHAHTQHTKARHTHGNHAVAGDLHSTHATSAEPVFSPASGPMDQSATRGATLYVTLEPCNHHGLTPPCSRAIVEAGITDVVYALADPNPRAAGGGKWLADQGVRVTHGVMENEARQQNRFFLKHVSTRLPYVIAKSATSLDGRVATRSGHSQWITGPESRQRGHELRQAVDAIVVGADTVIADNPSLTTRLPESICKADLIRHPRPIVLDSTGRIPLDTQLLSGTLPTRTLIATTELMSKAHHQTLESRGFDVLNLPQNVHGAGVDPQALLVALGQRGIQSVLLEGGASVHGSFRDAGLIDEIWTFLAPTLIGGTDARAAFAGIGSDTLDSATELCDVQTENVGRDVLIRARVINKTYMDLNKQ